MKYAVVTGAGGGIGREIAVMLSHEGYHIIGVGRNEETLLKTAAVCSGEFSPVIADVTNRENLYQKLASFKNIHVLVANSGVCERTEIFDDESDAVFDKVINTNITGVWNTFRAVVPNLVDGGSAVVISSGLGKLARAGYSAYAASKHAVLGITKCLAIELAPKSIRVNAVCPGWVNTGMAMSDLDYSANQNGTSRDEEYAEAVKSIPMKRFVEPKEVADMVVWLSSSKSSAITGQSYNISCGEFTL
ncbi:MAG: SDR family oxidoreductase [Deltaproteobacteria bacterium]|nr:SDR family oxidoreductase [Deltaproteobacteria bacterium]